MNGSNDNEDKRLRIRTGLVVVGFWLCLLAVVLRVGYLQIYQVKSLDRKGEAQTEHTIELQAKRGSILDRHGTELAVSVEVPSIYARPVRIDKPRRAARQLLPHLEKDFSELVDIFKTDEHFVWLERKAKPSTAEAIRTLGVSGIDSVSENKRYYPLRKRAGQLLGFVGLDGNGLAGVEKSFNTLLSGETFELKAIQDAHGRALITNDVPKFRRLEGHSLVLTIGERIQSATEKHLSAMVKKSQAESGSAAVVDVETGDILSLATVPRFDPNRFSEYSAKQRRLRAVTDTYEPGSVVKPFVIAGALEESAIDLDTVIDVDGGELEIGRHVIRDTHEHEKPTVREVVKYSSNIGAYKIAKRLGRQKVFNYYMDFGFGEATEIEFPGERNGIVRPPKKWAEITFANISFGQGFTATVLQLASAFGAIANQGLLMKPTLVERIVDKDGGLVRKPAPRVEQQVVSPDTAKKVKKTMDLVVSEDGTGAKAQLENFTVAGKTGTAQKVNPETLRYDNDLWVASFGGFAPVEDPRIAVFVAINEPQKGHYGGELAAPVFRKIVRSTLSIRGVAGNRKRALKDIEPSPPSSAEERSAPAKENANPKENRSKSVSQGIPDFRGLSVKKAIEKAGEYDLNPKVEGWGIVVEQSPKPKPDYIAPNRNIRLTLRPPNQIDRQAQNQKATAATEEADEE